MIRIVIESPYATRPDGTRAPPDEVARNILYARRAMKDSIMRGEAPFLSHLLYPQALDDDNPIHRQLGLEAGFAWAKMAQGHVVYRDWGITPGMEAGMARAVWNPIFRSIGRKE